MRHTPGPWYIDGMGNLQGAVAITAGKQIDGPEFQREELLAEVYGDAEDANARLIAAAPDLLAAGNAILAAWDKGDLAAAVRTLSAAITKATKG